LATLLPKYVDAGAIQVVEGGMETSTALLAERFDHIFYTGNGVVGSVVMEAAAKHLTPVALELGGKSPVWIDDSYPLDEAAGWVAWGKYANAGQTCVAPDYVLTTAEVAPRFVEAMRAAITKMFGDDPQVSPDFGRIVSARHTARLARFLQSGTVAAGGRVDAVDRYIAPTVLTDVSLNEPVMQEEIFGPILPVIVVSDHREAISIINGMGKPLALYAFTTDRQVKRDLTDHTSSGGLVFGAVMAHLGIASLPFGGVGASGFGSYHGEHSIKTFSHERAIFDKGRLVNLAALGRPPYTPSRQKFLRRS